MAMGRRKKQRQPEFWEATADVPQGPGHPFYAKLNELLAVFNPLDRPVSRTIRVDLYYTGLTDNARIRRGERHGSANVPTTFRNRKTFDPGRLLSNRS